MNKSILTIALAAFVTLSSFATSVTINFAWTANPVTDNVTKYVIYKQQGTNFAPYVTITGTNNVGSATIVATPLDPSYTFRLAAVNAIGTSGLSNPVTWTNTPPIPPATNAPVIPGAFTITGVVTNSP